MADIILNRDVNSDRIYASYSLFIENDMVNSQKMWILFN